MRRTADGKMRKEDKESKQIIKTNRMEGKKKKEKRNNEKKKRDMWVSDNIMKLRSDPGIQFKT